MEDMNFKDYGLSEDILKSIEKLGYKSPTEVQNRVIPVALNDKDIIVKSQTGSGKTASFAIPLCEKANIETREPQVLVLTPTRELCVQVKDDITNIGRFKRIRCAAVFGKQPMSTQIDELKQRVHIVVGTPGRVMDHIERGSLITDGVKYLIIDEADKMLNMGFIEQVETIINAMPKQRVTMLFSATMPEEIRALCNKYMNNPSLIEITPERMTAENIEQELYKVDNSDKLNLLKDIIKVENPESCIIFCGTKDRVDSLIKHMTSGGYSCSALHGRMLQNDRLNIMQSFKRGEFRFLVATDVAARGIDVEDVTHIINYDVPVEVEGYVHRIGRTGRAGSKGKAITLVSPNEFKYVRNIEEYIGYKIPLKELPSKEEIEDASRAADKKSLVKVKLKSDKGAEINKEVFKIYINAGKNKKIRTGDIVGAIASIDGVKADDIGIIDVQDNFSYIDILNKKGELVLETLPYVTIKGKTVRVQKAEK